MERNEKVENFINWCNEMWENMTEAEREEAEREEDDEHIQKVLNEYLIPKGYYIPDNV